MNILPRTLLRTALRARPPLRVVVAPSARFLKSSARQQSQPPPPPAQKSPQQQQKEDAAAFEKKKTARSTTTKSSLRRAAVVSERRLEAPEGKTKICTAYCTAEKYDLQLAASLLRQAGYELDPDGTGLVDQVIHIRLGGDALSGEGDIFIFPSGNIVSWSIPSATVSKLATIIQPAAETPYTTEVETEDLEYTEDPRARKSRVAGDVIILGTATTQIVSEDFALEADTAATLATSGGAGSVDVLNITLAKIAFSSGLARSTKLGVLESLLEAYLESTSDIPKLLSKGSRLPFTRSFILRKTGELLQFRAQLNLYSELTDSLPDLFWDSRHELGLEGYYDAVGRALDVDVRIRQLNQKLDYASGIVAVLREQLSEKHSLGLEWMIIALIAVEVAFELMRIYREHEREGSEEAAYKRWKEERERDANKEWQEEKMRREEVEEKEEERREEVREEVREEEMKAEMPV
ncbi:YagE family protein [Sphaerosporella brunnea]|uniref:YagE family protein n=1 Tax=Sphaerosporella brunnea TaxID=1250544 RepID=A0A5J5ERK6_9PEZI|nr:YagE family protein [Sphaerosporella brunnea]